MRLIDYHKTTRPIHDIDLEEPPQDRWKQVIRQEADSMNALLKDIVDECIERFECLPAFVRPVIVAASKGTARLTGWTVNVIAGLFGQDYVAEIRSIAKYGELPLSYVVLGNLVYDIFQMCAVAGLACSSFSCNIDGQPTLARNMDWVFPQSTGKHTRLIRFHKANDHYLSVSVLGCVGVVSAMCPEKWAVTINQAPMNGLRARYFQWPVLQRLRAVCDGLGSYRKLLTGLQQYQTMTSFFAHAIGTKPNQHAIISGLGDSFRRRIMKTGPLVQTNHHVGCKELEALNPPRSCEVNGELWYDTSHPRNESLTRRLQSPPLNLTEVHSKLRGRPVTDDFTMQQMIFQPASGTWRVLVRG